MSLRRQGTTLFSAMLAFVGAAVVLQLWLLTVSMEALLSGAYKTLIPAAAHVHIGPWVMTAPAADQTAAKQPDLRRGPPHPPQVLKG